MMNGDQPFSTVVDRVPRHDRAGHWPLRSATAGIGGSMWRSAADRHHHRRPQTFRNATITSSEKSADTMSTSPASW